MLVPTSRHRCFAAAAAGPLLACLVGAASCRKGTEAAADAGLTIGFGIGTSSKETSLPSLTDLLYAEPLLTRGWDGRATPHLAESWRWEEGGQTLRLQLKSDVLFHDGMPFTAAEAANVLAQFIADPERRPWGFEHVAGVSAPDPRAVLLRLSEPDIFLLSGLADRKMVRADSPDIGTGPFKLLGRAPVVETRRFDGYHGGASNLTGVRIVTYDTPRSVWAALVRGEIDAAQEVSRDAVEFMERSSELQTYPALQPFYVSMVFNHRHPVLGRVEARRALTEAVDKRSIIERAMRGRGLEAVAPIWPQHWAYAPPGNQYRYDPESARRRLDRAGLRLPGPSGSGKLRSRFRFTCLVYDDPQFERIALMLQRQLFDIGVDMVIELVGLDAFGPRAAAGDFDAFLVRANAGRSLDFTYRLWRSSASAQTALQNSGYTGADPLLDKLRRSTTDAEMQDTVAALVHRFQEDAPAVFIAWLEVTKAIDSDIDVGESNAQDPFMNIGQWRRRWSRSPR
jgi:peptide/nickel transport system substrate-binding protein